MLELPFALSTPGRWAIGLSAGVVLFAAIGAGGWHLGQQAARAEGEARLAQWQRDRTAEQLAQQQRVRAREQQLAAQSAALDSQLRDAQHRHVRQTQALQQRIDDVTSLYRPTPDAPLTPLPHCVFTGGFVSVYNAAIGADAVPADAAARGAAAAAEPAARLDAGVSPADLLAHIVDYGQRCQDLESQLDRLIDWQHAVSSTDPAPSAREAE